MSDEIITEVSGKVTTVIINRPDSKNSLRAEDRELLGETLNRIARDSQCRAVVITGEGSAFCAGGDLKSMGGPKHPRQLTWSLMHGLQPLLECIAAMDKPVIAAVNGPAVGFGMSLALSCDLMVMSEDAFLLSQFIRLGLIPDGGAAWFLAKRIGYNRMFEIVADAGKLDAAKCMEWGITNRVAEAGSARQAAEAWAQQLADYAPTGMRLTKRLARMALSNRLEEDLTLEAEFQGICANSPDTKEAVSALMEKRQPNFEL